ncbi:MULTISPECIES: response regulator transcription factor [Streptomyces]|uniref:response regulator transcription factor n=1 Tax=Streptomyces TaxID=1883 RepID=UPI001F38834D|nr:response regulator transcription factor [Streptomyces noursei]MCE4942691.1 response regulator transcription factor [Streptomyces noursei]
MPRILLIEDDQSLRDGLQLALEHQGHRVHAAASGHAGLTALRTTRTDLVVLDLMLPDTDGFDVCRRIRASWPVPVIMLTARGDDSDIVRGLDAGADDYVVKPVRGRVLDARIRAVLRGQDPSPATTATEIHGDLTLNRSGLSITKNGRPVALTPLELRLLLHLSADPGHVFARQELLETVWGHDPSADVRLVDSGIARLRTKIEDDPTSARYIQTARGFGYRFGPL